MRRGGPSLIGTPGFHSSRPQSSRGGSMRGDGRARRRRKSGRAGLDSAVLGWMRWCCAAAETDPDLICAPPSLPRLPQASSNLAGIVREPRRHPHSHRHCPVIAPLPGSVRTEKTFTRHRNEHHNFVIRKKFKSPWDSEELLQKLCPKIQQRALTGGHKDRSAVGMRTTLAVRLPYPGRSIVL